MKPRVASHAGKIFVSSLSYASLGALLVLILSSPFIQMTGQLGAPYKIYRTFGYAGLLFLQVSLFFHRGWKQSLKIIWSPVLAVLLWFVITLAWTWHFDLSIKKIFLVTLLYCVIFTSACDLGYAKFIKIIRLILAGLLILNFATVLFFPNIGVHEGHLHQWRGVMANKNIAGIICAATFILFLFDGRRIHPAIRAAVIAGSAIFLYYTWSRTPLISLPVAVVSAVLISKLKYLNKNINLSKNIVIISYSFFVILVLILTIQRDFLLHLTEDAGALSLRNAIWRPMLISYLDNPWLGSGYGSYWDAEISRPKIEAYGTQPWMGNVDQGHNGYLDLLVQTGSVGLFLAFYAAIIWPFLRFSSFHSGHPSRSPLVFGLIILMLLENLTETSIFSSDLFGNFIILSCLALIRRFELRSQNAH